jgi:hypothetical protein
MVDKNKILDEIFNDDPLGLLNVKPKVSNTKTTDERLIGSFEEITNFINKNNREPEPNPSNISEYQLYTRLKSLREDEEKMMALEPFDHYGILTIEKKEIEKVEDILDDELFNMLDDDDEHGLFDFKHVPKDSSRAESDFVARRKPCEDFDKYETILKKVQKDLSEGKRELVDFKQDNLREDAFYVHNGILFYLESISISKKEHYREDGTRVREDGRTRCIFENGTESNMLKRSVEKNLYANGKVVTENKDEVTKDIEEKLSNITSEDEEAGFIYVLSSKSTNPEIKEIHNLYKIGYSTTEVSNRIKNSEKDPTFLMAPVQVEGVWQCFNMNTQKFEQLLHNFFGNSCLNIDVFDSKGRRHNPQEWFIAPIHIIEKAILLLISGEIIQYKYDALNQTIITR